MKFTLSNNPIDKLLCWIYNKTEKVSQIASTLFLET